MVIETVSLISAVQALVLAAMLWIGTQGGAGQARMALRLRACALAIEASGWGLLAFQMYLGPGQLLLGGNALNLLAQGLGVIALRMLLGASLRWRLVLAIGVLGWLGVAWFSVVEPDYRNRVLWGSIAIMGNIWLRVDVLQAECRRRRSAAGCVLLGICVLAGALVIWRNVALWTVSDVPAGIAQAGTLNYLYVLFSGMQPLFASVGFLLLYGDILQRELRQVARIDPLTGVNNRRALNEMAIWLLARAARTRRPLGVLMLDADHFKRVNDRFGHSGGDTVLLALVTSIRAMLRRDDVIGRIGGEEFVVLAPDTDMADALVLAERIRARVESTPLDVNGTVLQLTVSIGVALVPPDQDDVEGTLHSADVALYAAKRAGRNRVVASDGQVKPPSDQPA